MTAHEAETMFYACGLVSANASANLWHRVVERV